MTKHKFAEKWRVWTVNFDPTGNPFVPKGNLDLTSMDSLGNLAKGKHYKDENSKDHELDGSAGNTTIDLTEDPSTGNGHWHGDLVFDDMGSNKKMIIVGKHFTPMIHLDEKSTGVPFDQNEEPWIITKP